MATTKKSTPDLNFFVVVKPREGLVGRGSTNPSFGMTMTKKLRSVFSGCAVLLMYFQDMQSRLNYSRDLLIKSGAHYVVDSIADLPEVCADINKRLAQGEKP